jgi:hypothetical protein
MTGIVAAIAAAGGLNYASGLYGPAGPQAFTITSSGTSAGGSTVNINYSWLGYLRPSISGTNTLTIQSLWTQFILYFGVQYTFTWGGSPSSVSYLWVGDTAKSGYNAGNANATSTNGSASYSPTLTANTNYPVRYQWTATLPYDPNGYSTGNPGWTTGSCSFSVSNGAGYYNSITNGF